jgi:hypothetical protein
MGRLRGRAGALLGEPFAIDERALVRQFLRHPVVATDAQGDSVVAWEAEYDGDLHGIFLRRVDRQGRLLDHEYPVNFTTRHDQFSPWAAAGSGVGVVTWTSYAQDGDLGGIFARLLNRAGVPYGPEIQVNQHRAGHQDFSKVGMDGQGNFVVAWTSDGREIYARRFDRWGNPLSDDIQANTTAAGARWLVDLETETNGFFTVTWASYAADGNSLGLWKQQFDTQNSPVGGETQTTP